MNPYASTSSDDSKHELERALFVEQSPEAYQRRIKHLRGGVYWVSNLPESDQITVSPEVVRATIEAFQPGAAPRKLESSQQANIIQFPNRQRLDAEHAAQDAPKADVVDLNASREQKPAVESEEEDKQGMMDDAHNKLAEAYGEAA